MYKIAKIAGIVLGVLGIVLWILVARQDNPDSGSTDIFLRLGFWMTIITAVITLVYALLNLFTSPDKLKKALIGIGAFLLVILISYFTASGKEVGGASAGTVKWVDAGLRSFYILTVVAIGAMVVAGLKKTK